MNMKKIYLYAAHTSFSPGGMYCGREEHTDVLRFAKFLASALMRDGELTAEILTGTEKNTGDSNAFVLIFHRDYNEGNDRSYGAKCFVKNDSDAETQYRAYRLLDSITGEGKFRYRGVHEDFMHTGFTALRNTESRNTFLFTLGFTDSSRDNEIFDERISVLSDSLARAVKSIMKEVQNEDNSAL